MYTRGEGDRGIFHAQNMDSLVSGAFLAARFVIRAREERNLAVFEHVSKTIHPGCVQGIERATKDGPKWKMT